MISTEFELEKIDLSVYDQKPVSKINFYNWETLDANKIRLNEISMRQNNYQTFDNKFIKMDTPDF